MVENFRPDVKTRLGFDYETLKAKNPRLILASISAFGQDGPYKDRPGVDQVVQGMSGLMSVTGEPGRGPMRVGIPISDIVTGLYAALGILTALIERQRSGAGPMGAGLAARIADLHARPAGGALSGRRRGAEAGRQRASERARRPMPTRPRTAT